MSHTETTKVVTTPNPQAGEVLKKQDMHFRSLLKKKVHFKGEKLTKEEESELGQKIKEEDKTHEKSFEQNKLEAKYKPAYEARIDILDRAVKYLDLLLPFTQKAKDELLAMRTEAEKLAKQDPPKWKDAVNKLNKQKIAKAQSEAITQANDRESERSKDDILGPVMKEFIRVRTKFRDSVLGVEKRDEIGQAMNKTYANLISRKPNDDAKKKARTVAVHEIDGYDRAIDTEAKRVTQEYKKYRQRSDMFIGINALAKIGPDYLGDFGDAEISDLQRRKEAADADAQFGDFESAHQQLDDLAKDCERLLADAKSAKNARSEDLKQAQQSIPPALKELEKLTQRQDVPAPLLEQAQGLYQSLGELASIDDGNESANLARIKQLMADAEDVLERASAVPDFEERKKKLIKEVEVKKKWVANAIDVLEAELKRHDTIDEDHRNEALAPLRDELEQIDDAWLKRAKTAYDFVSLDQDGTLEALYTLRDKILAAGSQGAIETLSNKKALDAAREKLSKAVEEADPVAELLVGARPQDGVAFAEQVERARALIDSGKDPAKLDEARKALEKQTKQMRSLVAGFDEQIDKQRREIKNLIAAADKTLEEMREKISNKEASSERRKAYEPMLATLQQQSVTLKKLVNTDDLKVLADAHGDAIKLSSDADKMQLGWDKQSDDDDPNSFNYVRNKLDQAEKSFKSFDDVDYVMISHEDISDKIEAAKKALGTEDPPKTLEKVTEIEKAITAMKEKAKKGKENYEKIKEFVTETKKILKSSLLESKTEFEKHAPDLVDEIDEELNLLQANGKFEDGFKQASADIKAVAKRLEQMLKGEKNLAGVPAIMFDGQQKAKAKAEKKELQKKQFDGAAKALRTELEHAKKQGTPASEIEKLTKELEFLTKNTVGKAKDYEGGLERVAQLRSTVAGFADAPGGLKITARNNLKPTNKKYMKASSKFRKQLTAIGKQIAAFDLTDDKHDNNEERAGIIRRELSSVAAIFNPLAFNAAVKTMTAGGDPKKDLPAKRKAREKGLRAARRMVKRMHKDKRLKVLIKNPFEPKLKQTLSQLNLALLDIEHNMMVSI
jgi:hypothetical protein